jgi:hypothetical protein
MRLELAALKKEMRESKQNWKLSQSTRVHARRARRRSVV